MKGNNSNRKIYSMLGLPASGKGTQADLLAKRINAKVIGIGDLIRQELNKADLSDPFYKNMKELYDRGEPQPDEIVIDMIKKCLNEARDTIILDNFPFSQEQSALFYQLCQELNLNPTIIIIELSKESAVKRALKRKICSDCKSIFIGNESQLCDKCGGPLITRSDDNEETLRYRINEYQLRIEAVKNYFTNKVNILLINGEKSIPEVEKEIRTELNATAKPRRN